MPVVWPEFLALAVLAWRKVLASGVCMASERVWLRVRFIGRIGTIDCQAIADIGAEDTVIPSGFVARLGAPRTDLGVPTSVANGRVEDMTRTSLDLSIPTLSPIAIKLGVLVSERYADPAIGLGALRQFRALIDTHRGTVGVATTDRDAFFRNAGWAAAGAAGAALLRWFSSTDEPEKSSSQRVTVARSRAGEQCRSSTASGSRCRNRARPGNYGYCGVHRK